MTKFRESAKSEIDAQRELLDSLMGINRNRDQKNAVKDFKDDRVCKFFITGMCPHDIFVNTKMDEGPCPKIHSDHLKKQFEEAGDPFMYDHVLEREFSQRLADADRAIRKARARVEDDPLEEELNPDLNPEVLRIHEEMSRVIADAEKAGEQGDIDKAQDLILTRLEDLQKDKNSLVSRLNELRKQRQGTAEKKLRVCDVCGSFLSIADSDKRLSDHFLGKQHIGYQYMRDALAAIEKRREERRARNGNGGDRDRDRREDSRKRESRADSRDRDYKRRRSTSRDRRDDYRRRDDRRDDRRRDDNRRRDDSRPRGRY